MQIINGQNPLFCQYMAIFPLHFHRYHGLLKHIFSLVLRLDQLFDLLTLTDLMCPFLSQCGRSLVTVTYLTVSSALSLRPETGTGLSVSTSRGEWPCVRCALLIRGRRYESGCSCPPRVSSR